MENHKKVVALLNGETVQAIAVARCLKKSGYNVVSFCETEESYGYHTRYADEKVTCPSIHEKPDAFFYFFIEYLKSHKIDVIIPMNDFSAEFLVVNQDKIDRSKYHFIVPSKDVFFRGYDKNLLMDACNEFGVEHPLTFDLNKVPLEVAGSLMKYPALIKPNITTGGRGITPVNNIEEFLIKYPVIKEEYGSCHLQEFIPEGGRQLKVQVLLSEKGEELLSSVIHKIRFYPIKGGSSCCNVSIVDDNLAKTCVKLLQNIGWIGFADFDLIEDPRDCKIKIMEINPRFPACIKSAFVSGIDYATAIVDLTLGKGIKKYKYTPGKCLRYLGMDFLWFLKSNNRWRTNPNWFNFFGTNVYFQDSNDVSDLAPFIYGTLGALKKQLNPEFRKKKAALN